MAQQKVLRTYGKMWKFERKIYAVGDIRLPVPVNPDEAVYFVLSLLIVIGVSKYLSFLSIIPAVLRYVVIPYLVMKVMTKKKFDGKLPHRFLIGCIDYIGQPKRFSRFQAKETYKDLKFNPIVYRKTEYLNLTEQALKKSKGGKHKCINSR